MKTSPGKHVKKLYDDTADSYDKMMDDEIEDPVYLDTLQRLADRIVNLPGAVVDTSCGSGHMLKLYRERFDPRRSLIAVDLSPRMIDKTRKKLGSHAETLVADMRDLGEIPSGSAAAVLSFFAIHHLDPAEVLSAFREWHRLLCSRGQLVVAAWEGTGPIDYGDESDVVALQYTEDEITGWIIESGFTADRWVIKPVEEMAMKALYLEATPK